jgi:hypothetical protein
LLKGWREHDDGARSSRGPRGYLPDKGRLVLQTAAKVIDQAANMPIRLAAEQRSFFMGFCNSAPKSSCRRFQCVNQLLEFIEMRLVAIHAR